MLLVLFSVDAVYNCLVDLQNEKHHCARCQKLLMEVPALTLLLYVRSNPFRFTRDGLDWGRVPVRTFARSILTFWDAPKSGESPEQ